MKHTFTVEGFQCFYEGILEECLSVLPHDEKTARLNFQPVAGGSVLLKIQRTALRNLVEKLEAFLAEEQSVQN